MDNRIKTFIDTVKNLFIGIWNDAGIIGRFFIILLSPIAFAVLLTFWVFKLGFRLLVLLIDEINFYWNLWALTTDLMIDLLNEFLEKKIYMILVFLWKRLFTQDFKLYKKEIQLSDEWTINLLICLISQLYVIAGFILLGITLSSLIYSLYNEINGYQINIITVWGLRFLLLTPLIHRYVRFKIEKRPFSWNPEPTNHWLKGEFNKDWIFVIITVLLIVALIILTVLNY